MKLIDTHAHLQADIFDSQIEQIILQSKKSKISAIINCATTFEDWNYIIQLSEKYDILKPALGVHPWYIPDNYENEFKETDFNIFNNITAVSEIGLDSRFSKININQQIKVFEDFLKISKEFNLAASVHCISSFDELISSIKKIGTSQKGIVIHAFNGSRELAESLIKFNIRFSIGGTATYMDSYKRSEMIKYIYPDYLMLETDSPDIPPVEEKTGINYPKNIVYIAGAVAKITGDTIESVSKNTTNLAADIFKL